MPFAVNPDDGTKIHYEVEGSGPPLLLSHRFGRLGADWKDTGYQVALKNDYRLVTYDSRGHGDSGMPRESAMHTPELHVGDALAILDELEIEKTHFFGYSFGGWIGFALLKHAPDRLLSLITGGMDPYPKQDHPTVANIIDMWQGGMEAMVARVEKGRGARMPEARRSRYLNQDPVPQVAAMTGLRDAVGLESNLESAAIPVMGFAGTEDPFHDAAQKAASIMPTATFVSMEGLGHGPAFERIDLVLPHVTKFLAEVESAR